MVQDVQKVKQDSHDNVNRTTATEVSHETISLRKYCTTQKLVRLTSNSIEVGLTAHYYLRNCLEGGELRPRRLSGTFD